MDKCRHLPSSSSPDTTLVPAMAAKVSAAAQGLTLLHFSAQCEHFLSHVVGCFAGFSDKNSSG